MTKKDPQLPPQNIPAERSVLGGILRANDLCDEVAAILTVEDFYIAAHQRIYASIGKMRAAGKPVDLVTLFESLKAEGIIEDIGGAAYLAELWEADPIGASCVYHAKIVKNKAGYRRLLHLCSEMSRDAFDETEPAEELISRFESKVFEIGNTAASDEPVHIGKAMQEVADGIDRRLSGEADSYIPTGLQQLDQIIGGLHEAELIVLAARPSVGKSAQGLKYAINSALNCGIPVLVFSLEMQAKEWAARVMAGHASIPLNTITHAKEIPHETLSAICTTKDQYQRVPLWIDETCGHSMDTISATARRMVRKHNVGLIIIDYLQLIDHGKFEANKTDRIGETTRRLKVLSRQLKLPIVLLSQLNRDSTKREDSQPTMADLRGSGDIEQDADVILLLWPQKAEGDMTPPIQEIRVIVEKQRNGPTGTAHVEYVRAFTRFQDALPRM